MNGMKKHWLTGLIVTLVAAFLVTGCAADQDPAPPGNDDTVTDEPLNGDDNMNGDAENSPVDETDVRDTENGNGTPTESPDTPTEGNEEDNNGNE